MRLTSSRVVPLVHTLIGTLTVRSSALSPSARTGDQLMQADVEVLDEGRVGDEGGAACGAVGAGTGGMVALHVERVCQ